jgi:transcriptional regulator with XRE-family HTH domain
MTERITSSKEGFARRLAEAMSAAGFDQRSLANAVGAHHNLVLNWTKGSYWPRASYLAPLAETLGVSVDWLLTGGQLPRKDPRPRRSAAAVEVTEELAQLAGSLERIARRARRVARSTN